MNRPFTSTEVKFVSPGAEDFTGKVYQTFREDLTLVLLKLFQTIAQERTLPKSLYESNISLIPKPDKDMTEKKKSTGQYH